jgi:tetratricopeptide (TPR) repeat protein
MFGRPVDQLLQPWTDQHALIPATPAGSLQLAGTSERELIAMAARRARQFTVSTEPTVSTESVDQVYDDVRRLAAAYPQRPLLELLGDLVEVQHSVYDLLEQRQRPEQAKDLYLQAGVIGGILAKASHDLADSHAALTQARAAFICADNADHDGLRAWLRGLQAMVAYWAGRPAESVRYAQSGADYAARQGTVSVWLPASEARALAALGDVNGAWAAIRRADEAWERLEPAGLDELGGICTFTRARTLYYTADALAWLPDQGAATEDYASRAVLAYSDSSAADWAFSDQAGSYADLAIARLGRGELDGAAEAITEVLELEPERRINGIVHSVQRVHGALRSKFGGDKQAAVILEAIEDFLRTPASAISR